MSRPCDALFDCLDLLLDEPTGLPEGTQLDLVADDVDPELDEQEFAALEEALESTWKEAVAGQLRRADAILKELREEHR